MNFWLGVHHPHWLATAGVPLMVSARRLRGRKMLPRAAAPWVLDSGGFSELSLLGRWETPAMQYSSEVRHWRQRVGNLRWAAVQDWMCEPFIVQKTGLSVAAHQRNTVGSYRLLRQLAPDLPWLPVLQGWEPADYWRHVDMYAADGIDLRSLPLVGLGSVCRRQKTAVAEELVRDLAGYGIQLHLFGFKLGGLRQCGRWAASADSMAWSFAARRPPLAPAAGPLAQVLCQLPPVCAGLAGAGVEGGPRLPAVAGPGEAVRVRHGPGSNSRFAGRSAAPGGRSAGRRDPGPFLEPVRPGAGGCRPDRVRG